MNSWRCKWQFPMWENFLIGNHRELHLQIKLIELQGLLAQTQHEPRLKGPFPVKLYRGILTSLQTILDKLHSMRCVTTKEEWQVQVWLYVIWSRAKKKHGLTGIRVSDKISSSRLAKNDVKWLVTSYCSSQHSHPRSD